MLFPTIAFAVFFAVVYAGRWALRGHPRALKWFLLVASYVFYGWWDARFVLLLVASSVVNHAAALWVAKSADPKLRRWVLIGAVAVNLGTLGFFKYYAFLFVNVARLSAALGLPCPLPALEIILPVGISFFTFQALSYVLDVYRRVILPAESLLDFALYLAFFPQLVAGPIVRASVLLPQLSQPGVPTRETAAAAMVWILSGLFKKVVVANWLGVQVVDPVYDNPELFGCWDACLALYAYAVQLYCDFSAYSDIAIGVARWLGFEFPVNFDAPYWAASVQEFWRRWHVSLSMWLRDYLYVPMGGSRGTERRTAWNLIATFVLGGLWHGAGWNFIVWGLLHGVYLTVERRIYRARGGAVKATAAMPWWARALARCVTFHLVVFTYVFFRARTFEDAGLLLGALGRMSPSKLWHPVLPWVWLAGFALQALDGARVKRYAAMWARWPPVVQGGTAAVAVTVIFALGPRGVAPFIYFQF